MRLSTKITIIKTTGFILLIPFTISFLFYVGIIVPEYLACANHKYEGEKGISIWGDEVDCSGENLALSEAFFQLFTIINISFITVLIAIFFWYHKIINVKT